MERTRNLWLAEKTENSIKQIIQLRELLSKRANLHEAMPWGETLGESIDGSFYPMLWDLTKVLSLAYDNSSAWLPTDRETIITNGERGLKILIGKYSEWDFLTGDKE